MSEQANPFPGPRAYGAAQADVFFGREQEIDELTSLVLSSSAVLLYAQSGCGKSSLLQAGLLPALEAEFDFTVFPTARFDSPGGVGANHANDRTDHAGNGADRTSDTGHPSTEGNPFTRIVCDSVGDAEGLLPAVPSTLTSLATDLPGQSFFVLLLDQFEEIFSSGALWRERREFFSELTAAMDANSNLRVVIALRADYLAQLVPYEGQLPDRLLIRCDLESLREDEARSVIRSAFDSTDVPLSDEELELILDVLFALQTGIPDRPVVRGEFANLIQLQILCWRIWGERHSAMKGGTDPIPLQRADLEQSMRSFVDNAITNVASETGIETETIRRWLADQLITPGGKRDVVLVESDTGEAAGLPAEVVAALERERLLQIEQRHQSRWAELTHDSMTSAVELSNEHWANTYRKRRRLLTAAFAAMALLLAGLFIPLREPAGPNFSYSGVARGEGTQLSFEGDDGQVAYVTGEYNGFVDDLDIRIVDESEQEQKTVSRPSSRVAGVPSVSSSLGQLWYPTPQIVELRRHGRFALHISDRTGRDVGYRVTISVMPMLTSKSGPLKVSDLQRVALRLDSKQPMVVETDEGRVDYLAGGRVLNQGGRNVVVEAAGTQNIGVFTVQPVPTLGSITESVTRYEKPTLVRARTLGQEASLRFPASDGSGDGPLATTPGDVSILRLAAPAGGGPFAIDARCFNRPVITVVDASGKSAPELAAGTTRPQRADRDFRLFDVPPGHYRVLVADTSVREKTQCRVRVHSFTGQRITKPGSGDVVLDASKDYNLYTVNTRKDAVLVLSRLSTAMAAVECGGGANRSSTTGQQQLVSFIPGGTACHLTLMQAGNAPSHLRLRYQLIDVAT